MPACSSGTLTNVLPHMNTTPQTQDTAPHPIIVYRHGADLSLCNPLMWNVTLEYTATHLMYCARSGQEIFPRPSTHSSERSTLWCCYFVYQSEARLSTISSISRFLDRIPQRAMLSSQATRSN